MNYAKCALLLVLLPIAWQAAAATPQAAPMGQRGLERITKEARHELVMLPYYGVFDALSYRVEPDGTVVLTGAVTRPSLKSDAENAVKRIEGVEKVVNQIEVLPPSPN